MPDKTVVFQYPGDTGEVEIPSAVDENMEVPKSLWIDGDSVGKHAAMIPNSGTMLERRDFGVDP